MFNETLEKLSNGAKNKVNLLNESKLKYLISSTYAGFYVGLGIILIFSVGGPLGAIGSPFTKIAMGLSFGIALSLVIMTASELFTGNNMIMTAAWLNKKVSGKDTLRIWIYSYIGNFVGSLIVAGLFVLSGLVNKGPVTDFINTVAAAKMSAPFVELVFRGILCNILVCLAVLCSIRMNSESGKLIMVFWCLFAFITSGFEHSIANMTLLSISMFLPHPETVSMAGYIHNLTAVTIGNIIGGAVFLGAGYYMLGKNTQKTKKSV